MNKFESLLERFAGIRVLVFGDVMLDRYLMGGAGRISPEAPVPVVNLEEERHVAGGAGNVAANIVGLGASVELLGVLGNDIEARDLKKVLENSGVSSDALQESNERVTTVKTRIVAHNQQLARLDRESSDALNAEDTARLIARFEAVLPKCNALLISDYGKGIVTAETSARLITKSKEAGIPVLVDPKGSDYSKYAGASVLTPNRIEAGEVYLAETRKTGTVEEAGRHILENHDVDELVITLGADGMAVFPNTGKWTCISASTRNVFDVTGAGDTVIGVIAVAKACGADLQTACELANTAAGMVVEQVGTTAISLAELKSGLDV